MKQKIQKYLFPKPEKAVRDDIDRESVNSMYRLSITMMVVETLALLSFVLTRTDYDREAWTSIGSAAFCIVVCVGTFLVTRWIKRHRGDPHAAVMAFKILFVLILYAWAIWVSWRHYLRDDELLTFFAVELMVVCFIPIRPWISAVMMGLIYGVLYAVMYTVDGAARVNIFNYTVMALVSIAGMIVRYHSQLRLAERNLQLRKKNEELKEMSRHDGLTGLRNRMALEADVAGLLGKHLTLYMIDIDYFKEINDRYGHTVGDATLAETAQRLRELFPESFLYRYGGDEFLVISTYTEKYSQDIYRFSVPQIPQQEIILCIGSADGTAEDGQQLFRLISAADAGLYEVKKKTHSPQFGGRERRRR